MSSEKKNIVLDTNINNGVKDNLFEKQKENNYHHLNGSMRVNSFSTPVISQQIHDEVSKLDFLSQQEHQTSQPLSLHEQEKKRLLAAEAIIAPLIGKSIPCRLEEPTPSSVIQSASFQRVAIAMTTIGAGPFECISQITAVHADRVSYIYNRYITRQREGTEAQYFILLNTGSIDSTTVISVAEADSKTVITVPEAEAIKGLVDYLAVDDYKKILVAHDGEKFDFPVLLEHVKKYNLMDSFKEVVLGFVDTMPLFKCLFPCRTRYRLVDLARDILGNDTVNNSEQQVSALAQLITHKAVFPRALLKASLTLDYYLSCDLYDSIYNRNKSTYNMLVKTGIMSDYMAEKTASSGLRYDHLYLAYEVAGPEGLNVLISLPWGGNGPRVTKNTKFIEALANYFENLRNNLHPMRHPPWYKPCRFV